MHQNDRVLRALRQAGPDGLTQLDFDGPTIDGGPPIRRLAARVLDLRNAGHPVRTVGTRHRMAVYALTDREAA